MVVGIVGMRQHVAIGVGFRGHQTHSIVRIGNGPALRVSRAPKECPRLVRPRINVIESPRLRIPVARHVHAGQMI